MNIPQTWKTSLIAVAFLGGGVALGLALAPSAVPKDAPPAEAPRSGSDLAVGYDLLERTLADEANLDKLGLLKTLTFDRPPESIRELMTNVADTAAKTLDQLEHHRKASPPVPKMKKQDGIGDRLQDAIKEQTKSDLLERSPRFSARLLLSQGQALGMLTALTGELEKIDPNEERREWLHHLSGQFGKMYDAYMKELQFKSAAK